MNASANASELVVSELQIEARENGSQFSVRATPRGRRNAIEGTRAGALLISVTAAPEEGAANAAIITLLAKSLRVAKSGIEIRRGHTSRDKTLWLALAPDDLRERLSLRQQSAKRLNTNRPSATGKT